ncbi:MAG: CoA transferase [Chloroflexi bacterium]|nr:CoA transferase [Chloroflexota bacterium]
MALPFAGVRVIDMASVYAAPCAAMYLGDLGADVVKLEPPEGDQCRQLYAFSDPADLSKPFVALNRNKRSVVVDIRKREGLAVLYRLATWADVFVINTRPGVAERRKIGYEHLRRVNPRLVYCALTAFGSTGPYAHLGGYDVVMQAQSGIFGVRRMPDGAPIPAPVMVADFSSAIMLAFGISAALYAREKTGEGTKVETSLLAGALAMQAYPLVSAGGASAEDNRKFFGLYSSYPCADGQYIVICALTNPQFRSLCQVLAVPHVADDPDFSSHTKRVQRSPQIHGLLEGLFAMEPCAHWIERLRAVGVPCAPVVSQDQLFHDPHIRQSNLLVDTPYPGVGTVSSFGFPLAFSNSQASVRRPAPRLGEHTLEVLGEVGYTLDEIEALRRMGVIQPLTTQGGV